jgi:hypothetical protein
VQSSFLDSSELACGALQCSRAYGPSCADFQEHVAWRILKLAVPLRPLPLVWSAVSSSAMLFSPMN